MDTTAIEVKRVQSSADLLHPGEYVFVPRREPIITFERHPIEPPANRADGTLIGNAFRYFKWRFGKKEEMKQIVKLLWPEHDAIILNCPVCNNPCATTKNHKIISVEPLTLEIPLTCPYCKIRSFDIQEGKLIPVVYHG